MVNGVMTTSELLVMPADDKRRWLINGQLREEQHRYRDRRCAVVLANVVGLLHEWIKSRTYPVGVLVCGEAGLQLPTTPNTFLGVDAAIICNEMLKQQPIDDPYWHGVPTLIVEILKPKSRVHHSHEKIDTYLSTGVPLVWVIDPHNHTVTIYRPDEEPTFANARQELTGENVLPGFRVPVAHLFA